MRGARRGHRGLVQAGHAVDDQRLFDTLSHGSIAVCLSRMGSVQTTSEPKIDEA